MKRLIPLFFLLVLLTSFVVAPNATTNETSTAPADTKDISLLDKEINLPTPIKIIFGVGSEDKITWVYFISVMGVWILILIMFTTLLEVTTFSGITTFFISLGLTIIWSIAGWTRKLANLLFGFEGGKIANTPWLIVFLIGGYILLFIAKKLIRKLILAKRMQNARESGQKTAMNQERIDALGRNASEINKELGKSEDNS